MDVEDATRILASSAKPKPKTTDKACLVHIYPTGPGMGARYELADQPMVIGRDEGADIHITDNSVSRRHATVSPEGDSFVVLDLQSTNGTFVNDVRVLAQKLKDGDYLHIGNAIYRYLSGGNVEAAYHEEIYRLTIVDALTGIHNKRYFLEFLGRELSCAVRYRRPLALIMFDIDKFKTLNDTHGHLAGDFALRELSACIKGLIRKEDLFARYGGEEFAVVMPETARDGAVQISERIRHVVEKHPFRYEGKTFPVTISLGVAAISGEEWLTTNELIRQADEKLYQAKREGRNRVVS
jgi:two-component system cell cycle response regulator